MLTTTVTHAALYSNIYSNSSTCAQILMNWVPRCITYTDVLLCMLMFRLMNKLVHLCQAYRQCYRDFVFYFTFTFGGPTVGELDQLWNHGFKPLQQQQRFLFCFLPKHLPRFGCEWVHVVPIWWKEMHFGNFSHRLLWLCRHLYFIGQRMTLKF